MLWLVQNSLVHFANGHSFLHFAFRVASGLTESDPQLVKGFLLETLVLAEHCKHILGDDAHKGLQKVEKANEAVFVQIENSKVIDGRHVDVVFSEFKLTAIEQNLLELV